MNYIKQISYEMRHQKMMTWVSISATALSVFLVMAFYMGDSFKTVAVSPETSRHRILTGQYVDENHLNEAGEVKFSSSNSLSYDAARRFYEGHDGVELVAYATSWPYTHNVGIAGKRPVSLSSRYTDGNFWKIFDFSFVDGKPFDEAMVESGEKRIILTRSAARTVFGDEKAAGRTVLVQHVPHIVQGVVEDVSPFLRSTSSDIYLPLGPDQRKPGPYGDFGGNIQALMLLGPDADVPAIQREVESRYNRINASLEKDRVKLLYHGQPYDYKTVAAGGYGANTTPEPEGNHRREILVYTVLLLLPAINLSSMTRSRMRHRISEIGVRRAFGASRLSIVGQMLGENFIITLAGGILGLILSFLFLFFLNDMFFPASSNILSGASVNPSLEMLFTWNVFAVALAACFLLNLLSAFIPSWQASRVEPSEAIARSK